MSLDIQSPNLDTRSDQTTLSSFSASLREISNSVRNYFRTPKEISELEYNVDKLIIAGDYNGASYDVRRIGMDPSPIAHRLASIAFRKAFIAIKLSERDQRYRADKLIEEAIDHLETYPNEGSVEDRAQAYGCIAAYFGLASEFENSTRYFKEVVEIIAKEVRASKFYRKEALWELDKALEDLSVAAEKSGDFEIARSAVRKQLALARVLRRHPDPIPDALTRIAALSEVMGDTSRAQIYREKLEQYYDGIEGINRLSVDNAIDYYLFSSSEPRREEVKELFARVDNESVATAICQGALQRTCAYRLVLGLRVRGELDRAEEILTQLSQFSREITGDHVAVQNELLRNLIDFYEETKMYSELEHHQRMRLKLFETIPEIPLQKILALKSNLVLTLLHCSKDTEALMLQREVVEKRRALSDGGINDYPESIVSLARIEDLNGNYEKSENLCREAMTLYTTLEPSSNTSQYISLIKTILASSLRNQGRQDEATQVQMPSLDDLLSAEGDNLELNSIIENIERSLDSEQTNDARNAIEKLKKRFGARYESSEIDDFMRGVFFLAEGRLTDTSLPPQYRITLFKDSYGFLKECSSRFNIFCLKAISNVLNELVRMSNVWGLTKEIKQDFQSYLNDLEDMEIRMEDSKSTETYLYASVLMLQGNILMELEQAERAKELYERAHEARRKAQVRFG